MLHGRSTRIATLVAAVACCVALPIVRRGTITTGLAPWIFIYPPSSAWNFTNSHNYLEDNEATMHGGFTQDPDGAIYAHFNDVDNGLFKMDTLAENPVEIGTDTKLDQATHALEYFEIDNDGFVAMAQPDDERMLIVKVSTGTVVATITAPSGTQFTSGNDYEDVNDYFDNDGKFKPSDMAFISNKDGEFLFVGNGYGDTDGEAIVMRLEYDAGTWSWGTKAMIANNAEKVHGMCTFDDHIWTLDPNEKKIRQFDTDLVDIGTLTGAPTDCAFSDMNIIQHDTDALLITCYEKDVTKKNEGEKYPIYIWKNNAIESTLYPAHNGDLEIEDLYATHGALMIENPDEPELGVMIAGYNPSSNDGKYAFITEYQP